MEKIDKNQLIGIVLLVVMWGAYMFFMPQEPPQPPKPTTSSTATSAKAQTPTQTLTDTTALKASMGDFANAAVGSARSISVENKDAKFVFNTQGGAIKEVILKNYTPYDDFIAGKKTPISLIDEKNSNISLEVQTNKGKIDLHKLFYQTDNQSVVLKEGDSTKIIFRSNLSPTQYVEQIYRIKGSGFVVDYDLNMVGMENVVQNQPIRLLWENKLKKLEHDMAENRKAAQINYWQTEDEFNDMGLSSVKGDERTLEEPLHWFSFKQKYFVSGFIAKNQPIAANGKIRLAVDENDKDIVKTASVDVNLPIADVKAGKGNYRFYFGPNEYKEVNAVTEGFHRNVYLGYDLVKPINRYVFVPLFNFYEKYIGNYGLLIILVVLTIKLVLTPLIYKSYVSSAKMRVMAPELAEIREKVGDDQVKLQQEQMKLYQQVGVNPLSGCIPLLLQMPILMSVFFLFPNMIMFRQKPFLWAKDLSTYDYPISWATELPIVGHHISLFVVLMTLSSLAFTYYNNQITPDQPGPIDMKKISYIFPIVFFFVLNSFPAALSFYYLVSNLVTIAQQLIVRKFVDEDKIRGILEANRTKFKANPQAPKKGKFAQFMENQMKLAEESRKQQEERQKKSGNKPTPKKK